MNKDSYRSTFTIQNILNSETKNNVKSQSDAENTEDHLNNDDNEEQTTDNGDIGNVQVLQNVVLNSDSSRDSYLVSQSKPNLPVEGGAGGFYTGNNEL